jgi:hypothetical protein
MPTSRLIYPTNQVEDFILAVQETVVQHHEIASDRAGLLPDLREALIHPKAQLIHVQGEAGDEFTVSALVFEDCSHLASKALELAQNEAGRVGGLGSGTHVAFLSFCGSSGNQWLAAPGFHPPAACDGRPDLLRDG